MSWQFSESKYTIGTAKRQPPYDREGGSMCHSVTEPGCNRRDFISYALALGGLTGVTSVFGRSDGWAAVSYRPLDPVNPDVLFGSTSSLWGAQHDIEWAIKRIAALGLQGI